MYAIATINQSLDLYDSAVNSKSDNGTEAPVVAIVNQRRFETDVPLVGAEIGVVTMLRNDR